MKKRFKVLSLLLAATIVFAGCGSSGESTDGEAATSGDATEEASESSSSSNGKQDFIIYNCAGADEYHEEIVAKKFEEEYGDKYNVMMETLSAADVVAKLEAQGFEEGDGNVNIIIMGDSDIPIGLKAGVFSDLSEYEDDFNISELGEISQVAYENLDNSAIPIMLGISHGSICYNPQTEAGAKLDELLDGRESMTYDELKDFMMNDETNPVMGRGLLTNSGPGDYWTWSLLQKFGEYGEDAVPEQSIEWARDLYENGKIALYSSTSATFKDLGEGSVDIIPHSTSWYYRLYALGKANDTLPEELQVDSFGLEDTKFVVMDDENVTELVSGHFYMVPANLSAEDKAASKEFIEFAVQPEINSLSYASLMEPSYSYSSLTLVEDENVLRVWEEVIKYWPERYTVEKDGVLQMGVEDDVEWEFALSDVNLISKYGSAWQDELEANIQ